MRFRITHDSSRPINDLEVDKAGRVTSDNHLLNAFQSDQFRRIIVSIKTIGITLTFWLLLFILPGCNSDDRRQKMDFSLDSAGRSGEYTHFYYGPVWVGFKGWYVLPGETDTRSGIIRFNHSSLETNLSNTPFQIQGYTTKNKMAIDTIPHDATIYIRVLESWREYTTDGTGYGTTVHTSLWSWTNGLLQKVE